MTGGQALGQAMPAVVHLTREDLAKVEVAPCAAPGCGQIAVAQPSASARAVPFVRGRRARG
jgi:hypothetical protein